MILSEVASVITPDTTVPLAVVWVLVSAAVAVAVFSYGIFYRLGTLTKEVRGIARDSWTVQDHAYWAERLRSKNQNLHVPDARKISDRRSADDDSQ